MLEKNQNLLPRRHRGRREKAKDVGAYELCHSG